MIVGSGVDVIEVARIERALARRGERFASRVFTRDEIDLCQGHARPGPHFAVRFAAKEALMKAVGTGWSRGVRWIDIEIRPGRRAGALELALHGRVAEHARSLGGVRLHLGVTRSRGFALAVVLLEGGA